MAMETINLTAQKCLADSLVDTMHKIINVLIRIWLQLFINQIK